MIMKKNILLLFITSIAITLTLINLKNPIKTKINFLTWKSTELSIGNLITISFFTGFTFSSLFVLSNNLLVQKRNYREDTTDDEGLYDHEEIIDKQDISKIRPPERDIRESQPTISVNYRVVTENKASYSEDPLVKDEYRSDDWINEENEW